MEPPVISVFSKKVAEKILTSKDADAYKTVVSIGWSGHDYDMPPRGLDGFRGRSLRLEMTDERYDYAKVGSLYIPVTKTLVEGEETITLPKNPGAPTPEKIQKLISFAESGIEGPILIHCYAGLSRSPAAAVILRALWLGPGEEEKALEVRGAPNIAMLLYADVLLERKGALWDAFLDLHPSLKNDKHLARLSDEAFKRSS